MLKLILFFVNLYRSRADFLLKKANFLLVCIFKGHDLFYRKVVTTKNISIK
jgi:hypothetical protein